MSDEYNPPGLWMPYSSIPDMIERQNSMIRRAEESDRRAEEERRRREREIARPCLRCRETGTSKYGPGGAYCTPCDDIVTLRDAIDQAGGMTQTADQLAEKLNAAGFGEVPEDL